MMPDTCTHGSWDPSFPISYDGREGQKVKMPAEVSGLLFMTFYSFACFPSAPNHTLHGFPPRPHAA